jgi:excisionase family DNA binding protein
LAHSLPTEGPVPDPISTPESAGWLALGPAASMLGVDPDTLRRWADAGRVRSFTTPGGHRRFARPDLERVLAVRRAGRRSLAALGGTPERFAKAYGREYRAEVAAPMGMDAGADEREAFRTDGRRLVEKLLAYLDADNTADKAVLEAEANSIVDKTAQRLAASGTTAVDATAAFVAARSPFLAALESLGRRRALDAPAVMRLYAEAATLLDRLLLRFLASVQPTIQPDPRGVR